MIWFQKVHLTLELLLSSSHHRRGFIAQSLDLIWQANYADFHFDFFALYTSPCSDLNLKSFQVLHWSPDFSLKEIFVLGKVYVDLRGAFPHLGHLFRFAPYLFSFWSLIFKACHVNRAYLTYDWSSVLRRASFLWQGAPSFDDFLL